jgi:MFS transporter, ACS family, hexuronate transporter
VPNSVRKYNLFCCACELIRGFLYIMSSAGPVRAGRVAGTRAFALGREAGRWFLRSGWFAVSIFVLCSTVNFLDRQTLAAMAPSIRNEFHLSAAQYGTILSAFALAYALAAPLAGWLIDRAGLNRGMGIAVGLWSLAGLATGLTGSLAGLIACRFMLGAGESAGMPGLAKANALYLQPSDYAFSLAVNSIAISLGSAGAPLLAAAIAPRLGWRAVFLVIGAAGMLWLPLWLAVSCWAGGRGIKGVVAAPQCGLPDGDKLLGSLLADLRLWILTVSNALIMVAYTVWTNWTTLYFVQHLHLTEATANHSFAWIPPLAATAGAFFGAWLARGWIRGGMGVVTARLRGCWLAAGFMAASSVLLPLTSSPALAATAISVIMFWAMSLQINVHILPVDIFGPGRAGLSVSILACSYGLMQSAVGPAVGATVDHFGFPAVCVGIAALPLLGVWILKKAA